jgi:hypothetical protein
MLGVVTAFFGAGLLVACFSTFGFWIALILTPAVQRRDRRRLLVLAMLTGCLSTLAMFAASILVESYRDSAAAAYARPVQLSIPLLVSWIVLNAARAMRLLHRASDRSVCHNCGYDIRHSPGPACPECGEPFAVDSRT